MAHLVVPRLDIKSDDRLQADLDLTETEQIIFTFAAGLAFPAFFAAYLSFIQSSEIQDEQKGSLSQTLLLELFSFFVNFVIIGSEEVDIVLTTLSAGEPQRPQIKLTSSSSAAAAGALAAEVEAVGVP